MDVAHTFTPSPDGRYAVTETEYQYTPLRIWDLEPGQSGKTQNIDIADQRVDRRLARPVAQPRSPLALRVRLRVRGRAPGVQPQGPEEPEDRGPVLHLRVRARARASAATPDNGWQSTTSVEQGAFGVDVRNYDGLVVDLRHAHGLWLFKMDGFNGWNGHDVRHAEHLERAGLGSRAGARPCEAEGREPKLSHPEAARRAGDAAAGSG